MSAPGPTGASAPGIPSIDDGSGVTATAEENAMKLRHTLPWVLAASAVAFLLWVSGGPALRAQQSPAGAEEVLLGFDPILLIDGREELGQEALAVVHDGYKYLFATEANRRTFERDPARYAVQLGGVCARMGDTVGGDADNYAVVDGRIYLFGSQDCRKAFTADPAKYLEPETTPVEAGAEAAARGRALVDTAAEAVGGALDRLSSYRLEYVRRIPRADTVEERRGSVSILLPDRLRDETIYPNFGPAAEVLAGDEAFQASPRGVRDFHSGARDALVARLARQPVVLLRQRHTSDFSAAWTDDEVVGGRTVSRVDVSVGGVRATLGIDAASGRLSSLTWIGRGPQGVVGEITVRYADFRTAGGLTLPHRAEASFAGEPLPNQSWTAEAIRVNAGVTPDMFARPAGRN